MKLNEFKRLLKRAGATWEQFESSYKHPLEISDYIGQYKTFRSIICNGLAWHRTPEGFPFWFEVSAFYISIVAKEGEVVDTCKILSEGKVWKIGCQTISRKQMRKAFRLLADELGYEIQK